MRHTVDEVLEKLHYVEKLACDEDLEDYILQHRESKGFLPKLSELNKVPARISEKDLRIKEKEVREVMDKIWMYVGNYRLVTEEQMDEEAIWYVMDEVGLFIKHSDKPNLAVHPFIYAPSNKFDDKTITFSVSYCLD